MLTMGESSGLAISHIMHLLLLNPITTKPKDEVDLRVGWVERSETHRLGGVVMLERMMGFAALYPSYGLS
jgi:hypothetical protein